MAKPKPLLNFLRDVLKHYVKKEEMLHPEALFGTNLAQNVTENHQYVTM